MKIKKIFLISALALSTYSAMAQTQVIAHRGYWNTNGSAQNSITALLKADSIDCYGSEFDVWLTADDKLVVNHDAVFKSKSMERCTAVSLTSLKLDNGEQLPTLQQYFKAGQKIRTKLILELKPHSRPERETLAVEKIINKVKRLGLEQRVEYISFSLHAVKEFIRMAAAGTPVFYLGGKLTPEELKEIGCAGPDYHLSVFQRHPEWIKECHDLGLKVNVWTVNKPKDMKWLIKRNVDFITTNEPILLQEILKKHFTTE